MSTATYPQGMKTSNNHLPQGGYKSWKGRGLHSNPVGVTATHIRPLTNMDPGNIFPTGFGLPRPIKHYRKGTAIPVHYQILALNPNNPGEYIESSLIDYNVNRAVKSSLGTSLGGGTGLISQLIDRPGGFIVKDNGNINDNPEIELTNDGGTMNPTIDQDCRTCKGVGIVSDWYPINNLTEKPERNVMNHQLCCNQQRNAIRRVLPASTLVKKDYFQTTQMYLYNRCQTFNQRSFNFWNGNIDPNILEIIKTYPFVSSRIIEYSKPGDPLSNLNLYVAQCNPNMLIKAGGELIFIEAMMKNMLDAGYITEAQYNTIKTAPMETIREFLDTIRNYVNEAQFNELVKYLSFMSLNQLTDLFAPGAKRRGCSRVYYKPNNPQFAQQGGVSSSTRMLKLNVDTISTAAATMRRLRGANAATSLMNGSLPNTPYIYKDKTPPCNPSTYTGNPFFFQGQRQNKLVCNNRTDGAEYHTYNTIHSVV